jgi:Tol biopolymer transport system component
LIAVDEGDGKGPIWLMNADGSNLHRLIDEATIASIYKTPQDAFEDWLMGSWSPDGRELTVSVDGHDFFVVGAVSTDGSGIRRVTPVEGRSLGATWSPDGSQIAATNESSTLQIMDADGSHVRTVNITGGAPFPFVLAAWNPVASTSTEAPSPAS